MKHPFLSALLATTVSATAATPCDHPMTASYFQGVLNIPSLLLLNPFDPSYVDANMNLVLVWDGEHFVIQEARYLDRDAD